MNKCKHQIDESTMEFVAGKGYIGVCKYCGVKLIAKRLHSVQPRKRPHMTKKERRRLNKE